MFIQHSRLDCYLMFKTLKWIFGKSNCVNLYEQMFATRPVIIYSLNELIDMYVNNKRELNKSEKMKAYASDVKRFIQDSFEGVI